jgi:peptide/nickel transport system permease protein
MSGSTLVSAPGSLERRGPSFLLRLIRSPSGAVGGLLLSVVIIAAFGFSWLTPYNPSAQDLRATIRPPALHPVQGKLHLLGTDQLGRDILSRLLVGLRISLLVAFSVVPTSVMLGLAVGLTSGYFGASLDLVLMRIVDAQLAIPTLLLLIAAVAAVGSGLLQIIMVLALAGWPINARILRSEVLALRQREFVTAASAVGARDLSILLRHVLPNVFPTVVVLATLELPTVIIFEAALSFLGLGIQPPTPSLGQMLGYSQEVVWQAWWMPTIPGLVISLVVLAFNLIGDRIRDVVDPRLRGMMTQGQ